MGQYESIIVSFEVYQQTGQALADAVMPPKGTGYALVKIPIDTYNMLYEYWQSATPITIEEIPACPSGK